VYLPLAEPLYDSGLFVLCCEWCIRTFNADPKVKSKAQKMFGYGDNPNAFVQSWNEGQCVDVVLNPEDIEPVTSSTTERDEDTAIKPSDSPSQEGVTVFDWFSNSGEWENHLSDLEELGYVFLDKKDGRLYFQTPDGDHSPGKQDGNIKDGVVFIHSKGSAPFENGKGYSIPQFFAGALYGDIGKKGLAKFAKRYLRIMPIRNGGKTGNAVLDSFLERIEEVSFSNSKSAYLNHTDYYVGCIDHLLKTARDHKWDIAMKNEAPFFSRVSIGYALIRDCFGTFCSWSGCDRGYPTTSSKTTYSSKNYWTSSPVKPGSQC
jgi:hypothetical protein